MTNSIIKERLYQIPPDGKRGEWKLLSPGLQALRRQFGYQILSEEEINSMKGEIK